MSKPEVTCGTRFRLRPMTARDIPAGMRLSNLAGWNQTRADWERFLAASPGGCFVADAQGHVAGTVATISYEGRFAWIGMVLVDPAQRGQGIGTRLLEAATEYLDRSGLPCLKLDATPLGKPLYQKLGFQSEYELERWQLVRQTQSASVTAHGSLGEGMLRLDREVFGADRSELLRSIACDGPELVLAAGTQQNPVGYALGRHGTLADQLGPWVAQDQSAAAGLLDEFLLRSSSPKVFADTMCDNPWARKLLRERGFQYSRTLTRMYRGRNGFPGRPELQGAILGPEFG